VRTALKRSSQPTWKLGRREKGLEQSSRFESKTVFPSTLDLVWKSASYPGRIAARRWKSLLSWYNWDSPWVVEFMLWELRISWGIVQWTSDFTSKVNRVMVLFILTSYMKGNQQDSCRDGRKAQFMAIVKVINRWWRTLMPIFEINSCYHFRIRRTSATRTLFHIVERIFEPASPSRLDDMILNFSNVFHARR
jgi:hypothetical protein